MNNNDRVESQEPDEENDDLFEILGLEIKDVDQASHPKKKTLKKRKRGNQLAIGRDEL